MKIMVTLAVVGFLFLLVTFGEKVIGVVQTLISIFQ